MIGINSFGWRLGNQLFQIAAAVALAKKNNDKVAFPEWDYAQHFEGDFTPVEFNPIFSHGENGFDYKPIPYLKGMAINGYFQSEKYFMDYETMIRDMFHPIFHTVEDMWKKFYREHHAITGPTCAVHVRRGDYLTLPDHHPAVTKEWYWNTMESFSDTTNFIIFSDDPTWCKAELYDAKPIVTVVEGQTDVEDFFMQQLCDNNIIANSSYSWWAAWLNKDAKRVIAPKNWFGPALSHFDTKDLIPDRWETV